MKFEDYDIETIIASLCAQLRRAEANAGFLERQNAQRSLESLPKPNITHLTGKQLKEEAASIASAFGTSPFGTKPLTYIKETTNIKHQKRDKKTGQFLGKKKK